MRFDANVSGAAGFEGFLGDRSRHRFRAAATIAILALACGALSATAQGSGEPPSRHEYVAQLEAICKPRVEATQKAMKGVRDDIRAERNGVAAAKFKRGWHLFDGTIESIVAVPRPPADVPRLKKWFSYLGAQERYLKAITSDLRMGHSIQAQRATARFIHNGNLANNVVLAFGFNYCSFRFSRFG
jgi:hypothetical protein